MVLMIFQFIYDMNQNKCRLVGKHYMIVGYNECESVLG